MEVIQAGSAGFCFGVDRAVRMAEELAASAERPRMLGCVIHNDHVMEALRKQGMQQINDPAEAERGDSVLLRAHGAGRAVYEELERREASVVDATCPKVARVHQIVSQAEEEGRRCVMIGDPDHPEVRGVAGWCRSLLVFRGPEEVEQWLSSAPEAAALPLTVVAQTTLVREVWVTSL